MSNATDYRKLQERAQSYGEHLDRLSMTMAVALLAFLGTGIIFATTKAAKKIESEYLYLAGIVLLLALLPHILMRVPRQYTVPNPAYVSATSILHKACLSNTVSWNRVRSWVLASSWISLMIVFVIMIIALHDRSSGTALADQSSWTWIEWSRLAAATSYATVIGVTVSCTRQFFRKNVRKERVHLRGQRVIDLAGYEPFQWKLLEPLKRRFKAN